jgi:hypothetical protein
MQWSTLIFATNATLTSLSKLYHAPPAVFKPPPSPCLSSIRSRPVSQLLQKIRSLRELLILPSESYESVLVLRERTFTSLLPWRNLCCRVGESAHLSSCIYGIELWRAKIRNLLMSSFSQMVRNHGWNSQHEQHFGVCSTGPVARQYSRSCWAESCKASATTQLLRLIKTVREQRMSE